MSPCLPLPGRPVRRYNRHVIAAVRAVAILFVAVVPLCFACGRSDEGAAARVGRSSRASDPSRIAARVDGEAISVDDVSALLADVSRRDRERRLDEARGAGEADGGAGDDLLPGSGLSARGALDDLVRLELLAGEARRRGFGSFAEVEDERRAALARALLERRIDRGVTAGTLDEGKLRNVYDQRKSAFVHGALRRVEHVVVLTGRSGLPDAEARKEAGRIEAEARGVTTAPAFADLGRREAAARKGKVRYERLPPFPADTRMLVKPFVEAAFRIAGPGRIADPVQTSFGWHVIFLVEELPAENLSFDDVRARLAEGLLPAARKSATDALMEGLFKNKGVFVYENALNGVGPVR
jgi:hypothetical protein